MYDNSINVPIILLVLCDIFTMCTVFLNICSVDVVQHNVTGVGLHSATGVWMDELGFYFSLHSFTGTYSSQFVGQCFESPLWSFLIHTG